jgi:hypothetical protein
MENPAHQAPTINRITSSPKIGEELNARMTKMAKAWRNAPARYPIATPVDEILVESPRAVAVTEGGGAEVDERSAVFSVGADSESGSASNRLDLS